jgi:hypothetical protein
MDEHSLATARAAIRLLCVHLFIPTSGVNTARSVSDSANAHPRFSQRLLVVPCSDRLRQKNIQEPGRVIPTRICAGISSSALVSVSSTGVRLVSSCFVGGVGSVLARC